MTQHTRYERYDTHACIDREDAEQMGVHLLALAPLLQQREVILHLDRCDHKTNLHYARLLRIVQRATQPNAFGRAACEGVEKITLEIENGTSIFTISTRYSQFIIDVATRRMKKEPLMEQVVPIDSYGQRRRRA